MQLKYGSDKARLEKSETRRKHLLNLVHHLKGNIRVLCRIRPVLENEFGTTVSVKATGSDTAVVTTESRGKNMI